MWRKHKWPSQGSLCYVLLLLIGCRETSVRLIYFYLTKSSGKNAEQWPQMHDRTYLQTPGIAHIPPGWTVPYGLSPAFTETKLTQFSEPKLKWKANWYFLVGTTQSCYLFSYQKKPPLEFEEKIFSPRSPPYFRMHSSQPLFFFWLSG